MKMDLKTKRGAPQKNRQLEARDAVQRGGAA